MTREAMLRFIRESCVFWSGRMRRFVAAMLITILSAAGVYADERPFGYKEAAAAFGKLTPDARIHLQVLLTAAGYWPNVPNLQFSTRLFTAMGQFQSAVGDAPS